LLIEKPEASPSLNSYIFRSFLYMEEIESYILNLF